MKKKLIITAGLLMLSLLTTTGCGTDAEAGNQITVISREDGSGTRGAFIELFGIEEKDASGTKIDRTTEDAEIINNNAVVMTSIAGNKNAIGYISLGSLNETIKALKIDGAAATAENIKSGTYQFARPFSIVVKDTSNEAANDFIKFIHSAEGQTVIADNHYISLDAEGSYEPAGITGSIVVAGSSSVTPVMEKLKEAYIEQNPGMVIEIQQSDSTTGVSSVLDGICNIGMVSRDLKDSEKEAGLEAQVIAMDGIAIIVNRQNPVEELSSSQVKDIFIGETGDWSYVQ